MSTRYFNGMEEYNRHLREMARSATPGERKGWLQRVMGEAIRELIKVSFLAGKDPESNVWKSPADETQHGGRWAASYKKRPSGDAVTADRIRLTDTAELVKSYKVLSADADQVTVGPEGQRNVNIATRAETIWGNAIAGWGRFRERVAMLEVNRAWEHFVNGVPLSRIRKPNLRAF